LKDRPTSALVSAASPPPQRNDYMTLVDEGVQERKRDDGGRKICESSNWVFGDLAMRVETHYGEGALGKYAADIGVEYERLRKCRYVAGRYEFGKRFPDVPWSHHLVVAGSPDRADLLAKAGREDWTVSRLRTEAFRLADDRAAAAARNRTTNAAAPVPRTRLGDLVRLADHRLLCGDSTNAEDVQRLLGRTRPAMAFADGPYNVNYSTDGDNQFGSRRRLIANDALSPEQFVEFVEAWGTNLLNRVDGALYICMGTTNFATMSSVLERLGAHQSDVIVWVKNHFTMGRADYQRRHEFVWYGWREGGSHYWCGDRDQDNVWEIDRPTRSDLHLTMKPLALVERAIKNSSRPGEVVLDPFLGSGTTLLAAEQTGRICYGIEIDPGNCDTIIDRWEQSTGRKAIRESVSDGAANPALMTAAAAIAAAVN